MSVSQSVSHVVMSCRHAISVVVGVTDDLGGGPGDGGASVEVVALEHLQRRGPG